MSIKKIDYDLTDPDIMKQIEKQLGKKLDRSSSSSSYSATSSASESIGSSSDTRMPMDGVDSSSSPGARPAAQPVAVTPPGAKGHVAKPRPAAAQPARAPSESRLEDDSIFSPEDIKDMVDRGSVLGAGSFGKVYKSTYLGTKVAIKFLKTDRAHELLHEIQITKARAHPNVIQCLGACQDPDGEDDERFAIVTELMDGDMEKLIADKTVDLPLIVRLKMAYEAALGLAWLHSAFAQAILHRDFATKNLFVKKKPGGYTVKVADFGLSKQIRGDSLTRNMESEQRRPPGTPLTQAPEVMNNQEFGTKADVYSFGMVLWEMLTRQPLFEGWENWCSYREFVRLVSEGYRHQIPRDCPSRLKSLIQACWAHDPPQRPSMDVVVQQLATIIIEVGISDVDGRVFWAEHTSRDGFSDTLPWGDFVRYLYAYLAEPVPQDADALPPSLIAYMNKYDLRDLDEMVELGEDADSASALPALAAPPRSASPSPLTRSQNKGAAAPDAPKEQKQAQVEKLRCLKSLVTNADDAQGETQPGVSVEKFGEVLDWFGPMFRHQNDKEPPEVRTFLDRCSALLRAPWFHGHVDAQWAQQYIADAPVGTFLVRYSAEPGCFTIVVKAAGGPRHVRIGRKANGMYYVSQKSEFASVPELVARVKKYLGMTSPAPGSHFAQIFAAKNASSSNLTKK